MPQGGNVEVSMSRERVTAPRDEGGPAEVYLCMRVKDEGTGIPGEAIEHIFEPFYTTKGSSQGTGLGLSIAKDIIEDHGGWIVAESEPGRGTCFSIYLPLEEKACSTAS
jgi:signal transduction histidine kinase